MTKGEKKVSYYYGYTNKLNAGIQGEYYIQGDIIYANIFRLSSIKKGENVESQVLIHDNAHKRNKERSNDVI